MLGNVMVGQSGGPTAVINASVAGVYAGAREAGATRIYGMLNGVEGLKNGRFVDLGGLLASDVELEILKRTPASALGTCRYKLGDVSENEADYLSIFEHLRKLDVRSFFYVGGNDSMDSLTKIGAYAAARGVDLRVMGVPKTIDNDLPVTDHTPGFGSAAKYVATALKELIADVTAYNQKSVLIVEIMGRNAGWLAAAAALAAGEDCRGADMILPPEVPLCEEHFVKRAKEIISAQKTLVIAVSEGVKDVNGEYLSTKSSGNTERDAFGHVMLSGAGQYLANLLRRELGAKRVRTVELSSVQRCASHISSRVDVEEAFAVGAHAVRAMAKGESGKMITIDRLTDNPYSIAMGTCAADKIANHEKTLPDEWIDKANYGILAPYLTYARPLIQGEMPPLMVNGLPRHFIVKK